MDTLQGSLLNGVRRWSNLQKLINKVYWSILVVSVLATVRHWRVNF